MRLPVLTGNHFSNTEGAGNLLLLDQLRVLDCHTELFGKELGVLDRRVAAQNHEFFATPTHQGVGITNLALDELREVHQDFVTHHVAVSIVHMLEVVNIQNHEGHRAIVLAQVFLFAHEHAAKASTVEATRKRVFLAGLFVFALLDFESAQVLFEFFTLFLAGRTFTAVVKEADHQNHEEGNEPEGHKCRRKFSLRNLLALEAETLDFKRSVTKRSVRTRLNFNQRNVRKVDPCIVDVNAVLCHPRHR